jgi:hypothetical protein
MSDSCYVVFGFSSQPRRPIILDEFTYCCQLSVQKKAEIEVLSLFTIIFTLSLYANLCTSFSVNLKKKKNLKLLFPK